MSAEKIPLCFTIKEYMFWKKGGPPIDKNGCCRDCTPEYRDRMILEKRCEYPATYFYLDKDGGLVGKRQKFLPEEHQNDVRNFKNDKPKSNRRKRRDGA